MAYQNRPIRCIGEITPQHMDDSAQEQTAPDQQSKSRFKRLSLEGLRFLLRYLRPYRGKFLISMIALLFSSFAGLAFPGMAGVMVDAAQNPGDSLLGNLNMLALVFLGAMVLQALFSFIRTYYLQEVTERALADLRHDLYSHVVALPLDFFHRNRVGDLTSRLGSDITAIQSTMTTTLSEMIRQTILLIGGIVLVILISPKLTLVILGALPVVVVLAVLFGRVIRKASKQVQDHYAELNTIAEESFQAITVVKAFTAELREARRFDDKLGAIIALSLKVARARGAFIAFVIFLLFGGIVGVIWYGGTLVQSNDISTGELLSFVLYAAFVGGAMGSFADLYGNMQRALGSAERIRDILKDEKEPLSPPETIASPTSKRAGHLIFSNLSFAYPTRPDIKVIEDLSLDVPSGTSLAIVGPSGAGKSTVANLLIRFYEPTRGTISVDGTSISTIPLTEYRNLVAVVPQEIILFGGTIMENILYGKFDATEEEARVAAEKANVLEFVEKFPEGFNTIVGERGVQLSGGQRQRIAIARAILKDPAILILDEATSALDSESESLVQEALKRVMEERTTIVIAHRLSTVRDADQIVVLRNGKSVEYGKYDELIAAGGIFAGMVTLQRDGVFTEM